ncbi:phage tail protein [Alkalibacterium pelagium]|uniref:Phage-related protein n=1 Tax=Alkalibacterium pelagium TaxID=426702 RepID=A0A1H7IM54_9LACT|nr:hypothetical protein [Alkalibacterium pelagium]GEN50086.1 hypothetical protein APE02nite_07510 [Alkalibacterium pelagium]SEK61805.1 Phage-related protein [Alkalibacterium pelagium]
MSDGRVVIDVDLDKAPAMKGAGEINKEFGNMAKSISGMMKDAGKNLTKYVTVPLAGMAIGMGKAAMDLEATEAKYYTVFEGMSDQSDAFIKEFQKLTPATKTEARSMASGIQDLLIPMGFAREEATGMTGEFMHVAGALANFNSGTHSAEDVTNALSSAITGQYKSLQGLGIQLDATTVKNKAVEMGLMGADDEMNNQIRTQVLLAEVYAQSGDALTAYTEENLDAKTKMGLLKAEIIDVAAEMGTAFLPAINGILDVIRNAVTWVSNLSEEQQRLAGIIALVAGAIGPLLLAGSFMIDKFLAIQSTISGLVTAVSNAGGVLGVLKGVFAALFSPIGLVIGVIGVLVGLFIYVYNTSAVLRDSVNELTSAFGNLLNGTGSFSEVFEALQFVIYDFLTSIQTLLPELISMGIEMVSNLVKGVAEKAPEFLESGIIMLTNLINRIKEEFPKFVARGKELVIKLKDGLIERIPDLVAGAVELMVNLLNKIIEYGPDLLIAGADLIWELIKGIGSIVNEVISAVVEISDAILDEVLKIDLFDIGKDIVRGLWNGIKDMGGWLSGKVSEFFGDVTGWVKGIFDTNSPSRVFRDEIGKMLPQGLVVGVESEEQKTKQKIENSLQGTIGSALKALNNVKMPDITARAAATTTKEIITTGGEASRNNSTNYKEDLARIESYIRDLIRKDTDFYIDGEQIVTRRMVDKMNRELGQQMQNGMRWRQH